jgi:hypothetical protein
MPAPPGAVQCLGEGWRARVSRATGSTAVDDAGSWFACAGAAIVASVIARGCARGCVDASHCAEPQHAISAAAAERDITRPDSAVTVYVERLWPATAK